MSDSYVCSGATMRCTFGTSQAKLTVLPSRTVYLTGQPQANISDHKSMVNLAPFGRCRSLAFPPTASATAAAHGHLTPMPCIHNTPAPWIGGKMDDLIKGQPALLKSSRCQCMWGGTISLVTDGQVGEGTHYVQKKRKASSRDGLDQGQIQIDEILNLPLSIENAKLISKLSKYSKEQLQWIGKKAANYKKSGLSTLDSITKAEHDLAFINSRKTTSMDDNLADLTHSNPKYGTSKQFAINCATTTTAFMLRKQGYDVVARARNANKHTDSIAYGLNIYNVWKNPNGSAVSPTMLLDAFNAKAEAKGLKNQLTEFNNTKAELKRVQNLIKNPPQYVDPKILENLYIKEKNLKETYFNSRKTFESVYKEVLLDSCKEEGYYTFGLVWESVEIGGGHYTVIKSQKDKDGNIVLTNIEPQTGRGKKIDSLIQYLDYPPDKDDTIMRTDNKVFNEEYNDLFDIN